MRSRFSRFFFLLHLTSSSLFLSFVCARFCLPRADSRSRNSGGHSGVLHLFKGGRKSESTRVVVDKSALCSRNERGERSKGERALPRGPAREREREITGYREQRKKSSRDRNLKGNPPLHNYIYIFEMRLSL